MNKETLYFCVEHIKEARFTKLPKFKKHPGTPVGTARLAKKERLMEEAIKRSKIPKLLRDPR